MIPRSSEENREETGVEASHACIFDGLSYIECSSEVMLGTDLLTAHPPARLE